MSADLNGSALASVSKRYAQDLHDDGKSGYRTVYHQACRPVAVVESLILDQVKACGSVTMAVALASAVRVGVPEREASHALLRLVTRGQLVYDLATSVLCKPIPALPWYSRFLRWVVATPGCWLIAAISATTATCFFL